MQISAVHTPGGNSTGLGGRGSAKHSPSEEHHHETVRRPLLDRLRHDERRRRVARKRAMRQQLSTLAGELASFQRHRDLAFEFEIGKLLGHALAETTTRYAHLSDEIVADAAERVSGSIARLIGVGQ